MPEKQDDPIPTPPLHTPRWAFRPWISKDISTGADTRAFVDGFRARDIPVGVVVLDSPWETNYNTFVPNPSRYPEFPKLVADLRALDVRTVLWTTQMVNRDSLDAEQGGDTYDGPAPNLQEGLDSGYFVNGGAVDFWWKGYGAAVDFFNPAAVKWWHAQQDTVLGAGIAGWKLDFGEQYIVKQPIDTHAGSKTLQQYSEEYYRDFLAYGVHRRGPEEFVTMVRPWDESYGFPGRFYARPEHAPVAWVGDNRRDWIGLADALDHMFRSAKAGYLVVGSDIGGYLDRDDLDLQHTSVPFDVDVFLRWTALGALSPFMQLHGRANITPWTVPTRADETVDAYRYWATLHDELGPFLYSLAEEKLPLMRPIGELAQWSGDYRYQLGEAFLVAPILDATGVRDVTLPAGARWFDWWRPGEAAIEGGTKLSAYDVGGKSRIPLFLREGAIVPLDVRSAVTGLGSAASKERLTVLIVPGPAATRFTLHEDDGATTRIESSPSAITLSRIRRPTLLRIRVAAVAGVRVDDTELANLTAAELDGATTGWTFDPGSRILTVKVAGGGGPRSVTLK